jgi:hypothetical protein
MVKSEVRQCYFTLRRAVTLFLKLPCNRSKRQTLLHRTHPQHSVQQGVMLHILAMITPLVMGGGHCTTNKHAQTFGKTVHLFCDRDQRWHNKLSCCPSSMQEHNDANPLHPYATIQYSDKALILLH